MRNVKIIGGLLWVLNGLLGAGIVVFAFQFLIFPQDAGLLRGFDPSLSGGPRQPERPVLQASDEILKRLRNPIEPTSGPAAARAPSTFRAALKGVMTGESPGRGVAFLKTAGRGVELVAYPDEPILYDGKPFDELSGWKLIEVYKDSAVFTNGTQREVVPLDAGPSGPAAPGRPPVPGAAGRSDQAGQPYNPQSFKSQVLAANDRQQVWGIDPQEIDWAFQNQQQIIDQDFQVTPIPGGGLKVENVQAGSIGATRGLMAGDVVKDVNGIPLNSLADIRNLMNNPSLRRHSSMRLTVERAGKPMIIVYQPLRR